jgi:hypothetical protein
MPAVPGAEAFRQARQYLWVEDMLGADRQHGGRIEWQYRQPAAHPAPARVGGLHLAPEAHHTPAASCCSSSGFSSGYARASRWCGQQCRPGPIPDWVC